MKLSSHVVSDSEFDDVESDVVGGSFNKYRRVGQGEVTCPSCSTFRGWLGCARVELHDKVTLDGVDHEGKVFVHPVFWSCDKPSCPRCHRHGWAVREAGKIEKRFAGANASVKPEHIVVSPSKKDWVLNVESLRRKAVEIARARGVIGGVVMYHQERFTRVRGWFLSVHFHLLGYLDGGYACRRCEKLPIACKDVCAGCSGFEALTRRLNEKDGWIVKVLGERKTVGGTAWYQLNHSSYRVGAKRANIATWFGTCSYRRLKVKIEREHRVCPLCQHDLVKLEYLGDKAEILALMGFRWCHCENLDFWSELCEDGRRVWVEVEVDKSRWDDG